MQSTPGARRAWHVLAISGSLRSGSHNRSLLRAPAEIAPQQLSIRIYDGVGTLPHFDEDLERVATGLPEPVARMVDAVAAADGLLIATPEYSWSIPGVLKNALDWLSRPPHEVLARKPVAIVGASTGRWGTRQAQSVLRHTLAATESVVMPAPTLFVRSAERLFDANGTLIDRSTRDGLSVVLAGFLRWLELVAGDGRTTCRGVDQEAPDVNDNRRSSRRPA